MKKLSQEEKEKIWNYWIGVSNDYVKSSDQPDIPLGVGEYLGQVTHLNTGKKFGFINSSTQDFYFTLQDVSNRSILGKGAFVSFNLKKGKRNDLIATSITVIFDAKSFKEYKQDRLRELEPKKPDRPDRNRMLKIGDIRIKKSEIKRYMEGEFDEIVIIPYRGRKIIVTFGEGYSRNLALLELDREMSNEDSFISF